MNAARRPLIVGNWKMHKTIAETRAFVAALRALPLPLEHVDAVVCPPFTALAAAHEALAGTGVGLGAQNMNWAEQGAYTGEISPLMLAEVGVTWVVLGHSERRALFGELDERVNEKVRSALQHGITPIVAVGETGEEHAAGLARRKVEAQTQAAFAGLETDDVARRFAGRCKRDHGRNPRCRSRLERRADAVRRQHDAGQRRNFSRAARHRRRPGRRREPAARKLRGDARRRAARSRSVTKAGQSA